MQYNIEITDTFNGEANYCWTVREKFFADYDLSDVELAKEAIKVMGWGEDPVNIEIFADMIRITPQDSNIVAHVSWDDVV